VPVSPVPPDLRDSADALSFALTRKLLLVAVRDRYGMAEPRRLVLRPPPDLSSPHDPCHTRASV